MQLGNHKFLFLFILFLLLQSCSIMDSMMEGSFDSSHHRYDGDSYNDPSVDNGTLGFNIAAMVMLGTAEGQIPGPQSINRRLKSDYYAMIAGNGHGPYKTGKTDFRNDYQAIASGSGYAYHFYTPLSQPSYSTSTRNRFYKAGEANFMNNFRVLTGLEYILKNSKDGDDKIRSGYLEVPVYFTYYRSFENKGSFFGGVGPYFAYGIGGKTKSNNGSTKTFDKENGFKRFDAGISVTAGYKLPMELSFRLAYDLGLADIDRIEVDHTKNRSFSINIGYPIRKILKK